MSEATDRMDMLALRTRSSKTMKCDCGADLFITDTGLLCGTCDRRVIPFGEETLKELRGKHPSRLIEHAGEFSEPEPCDECEGKGYIECTSCDGTGCYECDCCGSDVDCENCLGEGALNCPSCGNTGKYRRRVSNRS